MSDAQLRLAERALQQHPTVEGAYALWTLRQRAGLPIWQIPVFPREMPEGADEDVAQELFDLAWSDWVSNSPGLQALGILDPNFNMLPRLYYMEDNLKKKILKTSKKPSAKGAYDFQKAEKLWLYLADNAAKVYNYLNNPNGPITLKGISPATRLATARLLAMNFERRLASGESVWPYSD